MSEECDFEIMKAFVGGDSWVEIRKCMEASEWRSEGKAFQAEPNMERPWGKNELGKFWKKKKNHMTREQEKGTVRDEVTDKGRGQILLTFL